jgi:hypothetical protein
VIRTDLFLVVLYPLTQMLAKLQMDLIVFHDIYKPRDSCKLDISLGHT